MEYVTFTVIVIVLSGMAGFVMALRDRIRKLERSVDVLEAIKEDDQAAIRMIKESFDDMGNNNVNE